jgi:hypothetical protein
MLECIPLMKTYGKKEQAIQDMNALLRKLEHKDETFKEY